MHRSGLAIQPDTLWRVENGEEADIEKSGGDSARGEGLSRQVPEETVEVRPTNL